MEKLALDAYVYTFPLVFNIQQIKRYLKVGADGTGGAGFNAFSHASRLADADSKFVSVNNDTIYSIAGINLSAGPVILELPDSPDRYYVGQVIDAWSNNFAYVGSRGTEGKAERIYLVPPHFDGELAEDLRVIKFPTEIGFIIIRYAIDGNADMPNVRELQDKTNIVTLSTDKLVEIPEPVGNYDGLDFFNEAIAYMRQYPASPMDRSHVETGFADLNLLHYENISSEIQEALKNANKNGLDYLRKLMAENKKNNAYINGWDMDLHAFDYNDTYFEIGALNQPKYVIQDRQQAIQTRALSALGGLWGNHAYEAAYLFLWEDENGEALMGDHSYEITFTELPPVNAFWSLTMYDMPEFFLVDNPVNRYSIGDRTAGIVYNEDGSLTLYMSNEKPVDAKKAANWLPAPKGQFRPIMRMYLPKEEVFKADFQLPTAKKV